MRGTPRDVVLDEVQFMLDAGESPARIAAALGIKPESVAKSLWRSDRGDLARMFEQDRAPEATHGCADCGAPITRRHERCRPCGYGERERRRAAGATHCPAPRCNRYLNDAGRCSSHGTRKVAA